MIAVFRTLGRAIFFGLCAAAAQIATLLRIAFSGHYLVREITTENIGLICDAGSRLFARLPSE
ncbi:MAG: hypothetical protein DI530_08500 [Sphingomonas sp.]|uniref:hypothetical protein n=1 Tax=Sphingomonas sp. TaxID=28214 RepID=UPI000DBC1CB3|nr:hypothetical protein [Sphingomonas sp.]PZU79625.1 MAG: hypothetical protein DI530_08500 [Sphingomonas sp.]